MKLSLEGKCSDIKSFFVLQKLEHTEQESKQKLLTNVYNERNENQNIDKIPENFCALRLEIYKAEMYRQEKMITIAVPNPDDIKKYCIVLTTNYDNLWIYVSSLEEPDRVSSFWFDLKLLKE